MLLTDSCIFHGNIEYLFWKFTICLSCIISKNGKEESQLDATIMVY